MTIVLGIRRPAMVSVSSVETYHGGGDKLFKEGLLVHYVDFDDNIGARLGLRVKGLDRYSPDCDPGERGNCHRIFRFHQLILPG
jgi:hypothetical protein